MSYMHSWEYRHARLSQDAWDKLCSDVSTLLANLPGQPAESAIGIYKGQPLKLVSYYHNAPIINNSRIIINGDGYTNIDPGTGKPSDAGEDSLGHEVFILFHNWREAMRKNIRENPKR